MLQDRSCYSSGMWCDEGGRSGGDDFSMWRGKEEGTAEEKVDGGDNGRNGVGPGEAERSGEKSECVEDADDDGLGFNESTTQGQGQC